MSNNWIFLSYELSPDLSNYGNSAGIEIDSVRSMERGDTSNNSFLRLPSHTGTHIDYPFHFYKEGKTGSDYLAGNFIFPKVGVLDISGIEPEHYLITPECLSGKALEGDYDFLIIKTGFCHYRNEEKYWKYNWGWAPQTADFFRQKYPSLKAVGFDLISLSSYQQREVGRVAHKAFLEKNNILIVEDLDLSAINKHTKIGQLIVAPLRFAEADGAPVTILAQISEA